MTGLYVHIPFCLKKCGYCDFVSFTDQYKNVGEYIDSVCEEMKEYQGESLDTIYIGGGTPTSIDVSYIIRLTEAIKENFVVSKDSEITIECNPKTADLEYFKKLRRAGFNRISMGVQSLKEEELRFLGRLHDGQGAIQSVKYAKQAGFDNISLDLMFGFPKQSMEDFLYSLHKMLELSPTHLSCYSLMLEQNTPFYQQYIAGDLIPLDDEQEREMYHRAVEELEKNGYRMYEISNFAQKGYHSKHNLKYWKREPYIGLGVSAHSFYRGYRFENPKRLDNYLTFNRVNREKTLLTKNDAMAEYMFLGLRMREGILKSEFFHEFQVDIDDVFGNTIKWFRNLNLLEVEGDIIRLSLKGINVSNSIFSKFLLD